MIAAARSGDRRALSRLLELVSAPVYRFGRGFCGDPHDAEDVAQAVLMALSRSVRDFRGDASLTTWAYTVARNACARHRRRRSGQPERLEPLEGGSPGAPALAIEDPTQDPHRVLERRELGRALERAIAALPPPQREVLVLRDIEGLPAAEVGKVLGLGERAVKSRLHRARLVLREALAPWAGTPARRGGAARKLREPGRGRETTGRRRGCPDTVRLVSRYLEGELDASACARLEEHVAACSDCGAACETLRVALTTCRSWRGRPIPAAVKETIRHALRDLVVARRGGGTQRE